MSSSPAATGGPARRRRPAARTRSPARARRRAARGRQRLDRDRRPARATSSGPPRIDDLHGVPRRRHRGAAPTARPRARQRGADRGHRDAGGTIAAGPRSAGCAGTASRRACRAQLLRRPLEQRRPTSRHAAAEHDVLDVAGEHEQPDGRGDGVGERVPDGERARRRRPRRRRTPPAGGGAAVPAGPGGVERRARRRTAPGSRAGRTGTAARRGRTGGARSRPAPPREPRRSRPAEQQPGGHARCRARGTPGRRPGRAPAPAPTAATLRSFSTRDRHTAEPVGEQRAERHAVLVDAEVDRVRRPCRWPGRRDRARRRRRRPARPARCRPRRRAGPTTVGRGADDAVRCRAASAPAAVPRTAASASRSTPSTLVPPMSSPTDQPVARRRGGRIRALIPSPPPRRARRSSGSARTGRRR